MSLSIAPPASEIEAGLDRLTEIRFRAWAQFDDGFAAEVPAEWTLNHSAAGQVDSCGRFVASGAAGGAAMVSARALGHEAEGRLGIKLHRRFFAGGAGEDFVEQFEAVAQPPIDAELVFEAPSDTTLGPSAVRFAWTDRGYARYRLLFRSGSAEISVYTTNTEVTLDPDVQTAVAYSNAARPVRVELYAQSHDGRRLVRAAAPLEPTFCVAHEICNHADDDCDGVADNSCRDEWTPPALGSDCHD